MENRSNKRVLVITYEMIPFSDYWGGCQRMYYLAKTLADKKFNTSVVACKSNNKSNHFGQTIDFNQLFIEHPLKALGSRTTPKDKQPSKFLFRYTKSIAKIILYKSDRIIFNEPNNGMGIISFVWVRKAYAEVKKHISKNNIDTLIISGPPFTLFLMAKKLKKQIKSLKIIFDYRDPWNLWNNNKYLPFFMEKKCLHSADYITVTTDSLRDAMKSTFNINNCETIFNGYSDKLWTNVKPSKKINDKIIISYIGAIHFISGSYRDTTEFFKAYEMLNRKKSFEIRFIGVDESDEVKRLRMKFPEIIFKQKVSVIESLVLMQEADYLLNIHTTSDESSKYLIGAKIFDYIRSGKTIISINSQKSFEHKLLQEKNAILCVNDRREILKVLEEIGHKKFTSTAIETTKPSEDKSIQMYSREFQNEKFVTLIKNL